MSAAPPAAAASHLHPRQVFVLALMAAVVACFMLYLAAVAVMSSLWTRDEARGLGNLTAAQAIAVFHEHRDACDRLRQLAWADGIRRPFAQYVSQERAALYQQLLDEIGADTVTGGPAAPHEAVCDIVVGSFGNFFHCRYLSFVFVPDGTRPADQPPAGDDPDYRRYTPLGDGWFLLEQTM